VPCRYLHRFGHESRSLAFLCRLHLERIDKLSAAILELSERIEDQMRPLARQVEHLMTIPGVCQATAEVIIAETALI
jgi:transposase